MMFGPTQVAASISTRVVESETSEISAAHDARDPARALGVADERHVGAEGALHAVERGHRLALLRAPDDDAAPAHLVEVERVQRLRRGEHHVVRDVDHVRDRPLAGRHQPLLQPQRRGPDLHVLEHARGEAQADLGVGDLDAGVVLRAVVPGGLGVRVGRIGRERRGGGRVQVARHAVDAHRVGAVRRDLDLEHLVDDRQVLGERGADLRRAPPRTMIPSWSSPIPTSSSARIIPCDSTPRSFALPSVEPSGITAPGSATATLCPAATFGAPQTIVLACRLRRPPSRR